MPPLELDDDPAPDDQPPPWRLFRRTLAGWLHIEHPEPPTLETK